MKRIGQLERDLASTNAELSDGHERLDKANKKSSEAEKEVITLQKKISDIEEEMEKAEDRLKQATEKFNQASHSGEESERGRKSLEARYQADLLRITSLEKQLSEAQIVAEASDKRYDDVSNKIASMEIDLERAEDRAETAEM